MLVIEVVRVRLYVGALLVCDVQGQRRPGTSGAAHGFEKWAHTQELDLLGHVALA